MCSGTIVFLLSLSQISLASEEMVRTNSDAQPSGRARSKMGVRGRRGEKRKAVSWSCSSV